MKKLPLQAKLGRQYGERGEWNQMYYQEHIKAYYQLISGNDAAIGMIRKELDELGIADNTIIIYTSDNGQFCGVHGLQGKVLPYEVSSRIPLIVYDPRSPDSCRGIKTQAIAANIDFSPTILELAGLPIPEKMDGKSLAPLICNSEKRVRNELGIVQNWDLSSRDMPKALSVVTENWKYIYWCYADKNVPVAEELFDLRIDPNELNNIAGNNETKNVLADMQIKYDAFHKHWVDKAIDGSYYKRFDTIFDRNINWQEKKYKIQTDKNNDEFLKDIYKEVTGTEHPSNKN